MAGGYPDRPRLRSHVHVAGRAFGPDDDVPAELHPLITNPKAWDVPPGTPIKPAKIPDTGGDGDGPPPRGGAGSGAPEWRAYARAHNVDVDDTADRDAVIAALDEAGVPTERQPAQ